MNIMTPDNSLSAIIERILTKRKFNNMDTLDQIQNVITEYVKNSSTFKISDLNNIEQLLLPFIEDEETRVDVCYFVAMEVESITLSKYGTNHFSSRLTDFKIKREQGWMDDWQYDGHGDTIRERHIITDKQREIYKYKVYKLRADHECYVGESTVSAENVEEAIKILVEFQKLDVGNVYDSGGTPTHVSEDDYTGEMSDERGLERGIYYL